MTQETRLRRWRAPRVMLAVLVALTGAGHAGAQDWSLSSRIGETLSFESNRSLDEDSEESFGSTTTLNLRGGLETDRALWNLNTDLRFRFFTNDDDVDLFSPNVRLNGRVDGNTWELAPRLSFRRNNQSFSSLLQIADDGGDIGGGGDGGTGESTGVIDDAEATRTDFQVGSDLSLFLSQTSSLNFDLNFEMVRFSEEDDDLEDSTQLELTTQLSRQLTQRTGLFVRGGVSFFTIDDVEDTTAINFDSQLGVSRQVSPRLTVSASGGASITFRDEDDPVFGSGSDTSVNGSGSLNISYLEGDTRFSLGLTQTVEPGDDGEIDNTTRVFAGLSQPLTTRNTFSVTGSVARTSPSFSEDDDDDDAENRLFASISPQLSFKLTNDWDANLRYTFSIGSDDDSTEFSNGVFLSVSRPLILY